jgi:hypothetical protein
MLLLLSNDSLNCKKSHENTEGDKETGVYHIRGHKPAC